MRKNGSITVFLTLIFVVIMALITAVIENIRVLSSDAYVSVAADSAAETVMGDYNRELYEQYKLFGYGGYNGMGEMDINEEFMEILKDNLTVCPEKAYGSYSNIYRIYNLNSETDKCGYITEGDYFQRQISDYLKVSAIDKLTDNIVNKDKGSMEKGIDTSALSITKEYEDGKYDAEDKKENDDESSTNTDSVSEKEEVTAADSAGGNPLKCLKDIVKDGILSLVCDEKSISEKEIIPRKSSKDSSNNSSVDNGEFSAGGYLKRYIEDNQPDTDEGVKSGEDKASFSDKIQFIAYAQDMFSSYINNLNKTTDYGNEYIIAGKKEEKDNLLYVVNRLMVMRMAVNYAYIMSDTLLQEKSLATATAIAGVTGIPPVITAVKYTILTILAYEESCIDICAILQKRAVPMVKNSENFKMTYEEICLASKKLFRQKAMQYGGSDNGKTEFTYKKAIYMLQLLVPAETMKRRMLDLIQHDMRKRFQETFCIDTCICSAKFKITYNIPFAYSYLQYENGGGSFSERKVGGFYEYKS